MPNMVKIGLRRGQYPVSHASWFFARRPGHTTGPIMALNGSQHMVCVNEVPFGVPMMNNNV